MLMKELRRMQGERTFAYISGPPADYDTSETLGKAGGLVLRSFVLAKTRSHLS